MLVLPGVGGAIKIRDRSVHPNVQSQSSAALAFQGEEMSKSESASEYEIQYRSTIQPRTAVRSQSRQSGNYVSGGTGGGGGGE
ncbi:hypothetical protein Y032_0016g3042 [Ancylostoma ceylanicum]|nr:hypothetical protein Y032_0016g3042 [Ancylostoma ceylanicum]